MFAAFLGQMGFLELISRTSLTAATRLSPFGLAGSIWAMVKAFVTADVEWQMPLDAWAWLGWLVVSVGGIFLLLLFVSVVSQGALIEATAFSVRKKNLPDVGRCWHMGVKHFWSLFLINIFRWVIFCGLVLVVSIAALNVLLIGNFADAVLFILLFILATAVGMVLSFLVVYSAAYVVVEEKKLGKAIEHAWRLFLDHWLVSIEVGIIVLFLNIVVGVVVLLGFMLTFLPTLISWFIALLTSNANLWTAGLIAGAFFFVLFVIFVGSIFTVFTTAVWTYLFMAMHHVGIKSRMLHWLNYHKK
ncbi:MAG: hypothetical protein A2921_01595 [Candidatus Magasanikbacteria bacterium RIFCSPLOWO2_01_FULL_43_20b]|uniref:Glycerophosphoryl diester phosphodiesterase membrane domain-containing protein n=1 Tax=Candidatus Magasanikbacteria bacterium RIFCSPLOWO2_12_FULL_43_12 TaxID=1798692 RepID=A0A1F6MRX0_9BACT|nr:MAG: hypothetical protein A3C74_01335 [Candidatus Magasanikbacteria bacterium RIFCSPHIGHO2_02_FULL_44_13]OGH72989.1 MAG: hypothetical protein A2921_01595 [Candidatus Magasanikbacteria bacterium RIFCSPLOWO2_01_FULL_43_20b]OGH74173.1 MAG: hypothetical protein A3G00_04890 [Candidatus Magasanikbacteria bacterium RIFCSPLOWO2_12_FULL_43_12]